MSHRAWFCPCILVLWPLAAQADLTFSLDSASSSLDAMVTPDDTLIAGPTVATEGAALGLNSMDDLNGLSFGTDPVAGPLTVYFSVDRVAVGVSGTDVAFEAQPGVESASGDVYSSLGRGDNNRVVDEVDLGLDTGFFGDDLNGLDLQGTGAFLYFSISFFSASNDFGASGRANDVLIQGRGTPFAEGVEHIGLHENDDIDAIALWDIVNPGVLDPGIDMMLFSLTPFSPSVFTAGLGGMYSPADILFTEFTGSFSRRYTAAQIGLHRDDNVDALDTLISSSPIPEPSTLLLAALAAGVAAATRRLRLRMQ